MKKTILTERFQELAGIIPLKNSIQEEKSFDRFENDEGEDSVFLVDNAVTNALYDIDEMINSMDDGLNDNDLGGDVAKPILISIAKQLNDLHYKLLDITGEGDPLIDPYSY